MWCLAAALIGAFLTINQSVVASHAQPVSSQTSQSQADLLSEIRKLVVRAIGAPDQTVEIAVTGNMLTVLRVNSNMNDATHGGRNNEATAIAAIISKAIFGRPEFKNLVTLTVQFVVRPAPGAKSSVIDTVEFREDPSGQFRYHQT